MSEISFALRRTRVFDAWLRDLKDRLTAARIGYRLDRLAEGNPGDTKSVGKGIMELRLHFGPGFRIYYVQRGDILILLLCGGDKSTQSRDIERARRLAAEPDEEE